jgi:hypothetical protein
MEQKLIKAFQEIKYEADSNLSLTVWQAIVLHDKCIVRVKLWVFSAIGAFSLIGLVPVLKMLTSDLIQSGFYEYFSLAFSNSGSMITYWKDFLSLLAESLPIISIILSLTLIFIFFLSLKYTMREIVKNQLSLSF